MVVPSETSVSMSKLVSSEGVNAGYLLKWMDACACMSAEKFCGKPCVTASVDDFRILINLSDLSKAYIVLLLGQVNRAFNTSMEVGVKVLLENMIDSTTKHVCSAYFTFVSMDQSGRKLNLPQLVTKTQDEVRRHTEASERREIRLSRKATLQQYVGKEKTSLTLSGSQNIRIQQEIEASRSEV